MDSVRTEKKRRERQKKRRKLCTAHDRVKRGMGTGIGVGSQREKKGKHKEIKGVWELARAWVRKEEGAKR